MTLRKYMMLRNGIIYFFAFVGPFLMSLFLGVTRLAVESAWAIALGFYLISKFLLEPRVRAADKNGQTTA